MDRQRLQERAITTVGDVAGGVADPKTGLRMLRSKAASPRVLLAIAALVAVYLLGRWSGRHD